MVLVMIAEVKTCEKAQPLGVAVGARVVVIGEVVIMPMSKKGAEIEELHGRQDRGHSPNQHQIQDRGAKKEL